MSKQKNQEKALLALMETNTIKDAAAASGLSEPTLYRYLADPAFVAELRAAGRVIYETMLTRVLKGTERAVYVLRRNLDRGNEASQNNAARILLDNANKGIEMRDLLERIELLEAANEPRAKA